MNGDRKIKAIKFLRDVIRARDGSEIGLREAKAAFEAVQAGRPVIIRDVPTPLVELVRAAARDCDVTVEIAQSGLLI